jgi:regulatory protein
VKSYGYIDDRKYAEDFISCHMADRSRKKMELDLCRKGIDRKIIQEIMERLTEEGEGPDEFLAAQKFLEKKNFDPNHAGNKEKQKMSAFLYRKGFHMDIIRRVLLLDITSI